MLRHRKAPLAAITALALAASQAAALTTLFQDTFDRVDDRNIDASLTGITDNTGSSLAADGVYTQPFLDPNNAPPTYGVQDGDAANAGGTQIFTSALQLAVGAGTSNAYLNHNFINGDILSDGGFRVSVDVSNNYGGGTAGQGGAFAIGMSTTNADLAGDANNGHPIGDAGALGNKFTNAFNPNDGTVISDFWVGIRGNNTLAWGTRDGSVSTSSVSGKGGTISATFGVNDFNAGSTVSYEVFFDGVSQGVGIFRWTDTSTNYIGLDARDGAQVIFDNFLVETAVPPPKPTLTVNRDTGDITLTNLTSQPLSISSYSMITEQGGFDQASWNKVDAIDSDDWITLTSLSSTTDLAEGTVLGEYTIAATNGGTTDELSFGAVWKKSPFEDIAFELRDVNGNEVPTIVEYIGNGGQAFEIGDLSRSNGIDGADWVILRGNLTSDVSALEPLDQYLAGDLTGDGFVNQADFREFKSLFIAANGAAAFAAIVGVPEPSTIVLALAGVALVAVRGRRQLQVCVVALLAVLATSHAASAADLFVDAFDRVDSRDIDASTTGITNNTGTTFGASAVYSQPFVDPANDPGPEDADAANGGGAQILSNQLQLAVGPGTSNAYVNHNFTNSAITTATGFRVSLDVGDYGGTSFGQGGAFAIGMSQAEADSAGDAQGAGSNSFTQAFGQGSIGLGDFWLGLRGNSTVAWGSGDTAPTTAAVSAKTGTISAEFYVTDFAAGGNVAYEVFFDGASQGFGVFEWSGTNENFIGLDARDGASVNLDNFKVETVTGLAPHTLRLRVDPNTGAASIMAGASANALDFYEITSASGGLVAGAFNGVGGDAGLPLGDGSGNGWELGGANSATSLTETYLASESTIAAGATTLPIGSIYNTGLDTRDLQFAYTDSAGVTRLGFVEYVSGGALPDFNSDSRVDGGDFLIWQRGVGTGTTFAQGDANGDGAVNAADLAEWSASYGASAVTASLGTVPEPATWLLVSAAAGLAATAARRRG